MDKNSEPDSKSQSVAQPEPNNDRSAKKLPDAFALFGLSWQALKLNFWTFVLAVITPILLLIIPGLLMVAGFYTRSSSYLNTHTALPEIFNVIAILLGILGIFACTFIYTVLLAVVKLQSAKGIKTDLRTAFRLTRPVFWNTLAVYIVRSLVIFFGFLLLIVPGLFLWRRYMLAVFYAVDQNMGVNDAMTKSAQDAKPFSGEIWGMIGIYILISFAGFVPIIGYLIGTVASIVYCCAQAIRYLQVKEAVS